MPPVSRIGDSLSTGHGCVGTTTIAGSNTDETVRANGIPIIVIDAPTVSHPVPPDPPCAPHVAVTSSGSGTVSIGGIPVCRIGDAADAGAMTGGSPTVSAG